MTAKAISPMYITFICTCSLVTMPKLVNCVCPFLTNCSGNDLPVFCITILQIIIIARCINTIYDFMHSSTMHVDILPRELIHFMLHISLFMPSIFMNFMNSATLQASCLEWHICQDLVSGSLFYCCMHLFYCVLFLQVK